MKDHSKIIKGRTKSIFASSIVNYWRFQEGVLRILVWSHNMDVSISFLATTKCEILFVKFLQGLQFLLGDSYYKKAIYVIQQFDMVNAPVQHTCKELFLSPTLHWCKSPVKYGQPNMIKYHGQPNMSTCVKIKFASISIILVLHNNYWVSPGFPII